MDLTALVDVAIGLTFVYLGASLFVTIANEYVGQLAKLRARQLKADLLRLLDGDGQADEEVIGFLAANPAFAPFFENGPGRTYVDPNLLARQLVGGVRKGAQGVSTMADIVSAIGSMKDSGLKRQLQALAGAAEDELDAFVRDVSNWVDRSLTMMGEVYKKKMQLIGLALGLILAAGLNLDTFTITARLYEDKEARATVSLLASDFVEGTSGETLERCTALDATARAEDPGCAAVTGLLEAIQRRNDSLGLLPIGWPEGFDLTDFTDALFSTAFFGWLLTAFATSVGATFWFDLLSRLVNVRHGMQKPLVRSASAEDGGT